MRLKAIMLATVSSLAMSGAASSADLPMKAGPVLAPNYNWTGFYVGGSLAAGIHERTADPFDVYNFDGYGELSQINKSNKMVWGGGFQAGYNWQIRRFVIGVEADYTFLSGKSTYHTSQWVDSGNPAGADFTSKADGLVTIRARFGLDVMDGLLIYGTAGVGWLKTKNNFYVNEPSGGVPKGGNFESNKWVPAFVAGGGLEYMLDRNWSVRGEALWISPQTVSTDGTDKHYFTDPMLVKYNGDMVLGKLGVNYRF
jgi:outer membrane immunogenic protein